MALPHVVVFSMEAPENQAARVASGHTMVGLRACRLSCLCEQLRW